MTELTKKYKDRLQAAVEKPIYEYKFVHTTQFDGIQVHSHYFTEKEFDNLFRRAFQHENKRYERIDFTKRERK